MERKGAEMSRKPILITVNYHSGRNWVDIHDLNQPSKMLAFRDRLSLWPDSKVFEGRQLTPDEITAYRENE